MDTAFDHYLEIRRKEKEILLMTHIVLGYPSWEVGRELVAVMVEAGVDLMELQIPFSEPMADGPVILRANQKALEQGVKVQRCLEEAEELCRTYSIPFLIMTYYNIPFKYGVQAFVRTLKQVGIHGAIIPDLPPEEGAEYLEAMEKNDLCPILFFSPTSSEERMGKIASLARGFIYCLSRKGVTGAETRFSEELTAYLARCRRLTDLPLAVGFGVKEKADVDFLKGKADIAVIGSQTLRLVEAAGPSAVGSFLRRLR